MNEARKSMIELRQAIESTDDGHSAFVQTHILNIEKFLDTIPAQQVETGKHFAARLAAETALARANVTICELREQLAAA